MGTFWEEIEKNDPGKQQPPDWFTWPGVVLMVVCAIVAIVKIVSL